MGGRNGARRSLKRLLRMPAAVLIICSVAAVYVNSLGVPFLFDDHRFLSEDVPILLSNSWVGLLAGTTRPLVRLSLALNSLLGGSHVLGYHLVNIGIHSLAALTLFGLMRRTLRTQPLIGRFGSAASDVALVTALVWALHPLQTQSVTYLSQRAESLMGLWYLLTLYAVVRGATARVPGRWYGAAVAACALGMATKPVMVSAPLVVLLYDRVFLAGSVRQALRQRGQLYAGLAVTWGLLGVLLSQPHDSTTSAGFSAPGISAASYAASQPGVLLHYLRLAIWPHPLALDYAWPPARSLTEILPSALGVAGLVAAALWALRHQPPLGFLGMWWWLILAPTSSFIPLADRAFEHRLYLPLAGIIALAVCAGSRLLAQHRMLAIGLAVALIGALGAGTIRRNHDYRSELAIWADTVATRPANPRARCNLGKALAVQGALQPAITQFAVALRLQPDDADAHYNIGLAYAKLGHDAQASAHYQEALRLNPQDQDARHDLALVARRLKMALDRPGRED